MKFNISLLFVIVALFFFPSIKSTGQDEIVKFGKRNFIIPEINGFVEITKLKKEWKIKAESLVSNSMVLLGLYISNNDYKRISESNIFYFKDNYYVFTTFKNIINADVNNDEFEKITSTLFKHDDINSDFIDEFNADKTFTEDKIKNYYLDSRKVKIGEMLFLGSFKQSKSAIFSMFSTKVMVELNNIVSENTYLNCYGILHINNSVLGFFIYSDYLHQNDILTIKNMSNELITKIINKNTIIEKKSSFFNIEEIGKGIGSLLLLGLLLAKLHKYLKSKMKVSPLM